MKQTDALLALLRQRGADGVTPLLALDEIGTMRLAARVHDLRLEGHLIVAHPTKIRGKTVARYVLVDPSIEQLTAF